MGTTSPCIELQKGVGMTKGPEVVEQVLDGCPGDRLGMVLAIQQQCGSGDDVVASSLTSSQCGDGPLRWMTWRHL